ncbi:IclR family transcriptional regulator [Rhodococcus zopfii]|uniref:IclR family transcriptional regulator n=1 Tax=Rhodococcus zopfii TaxID=43772 RepID=A0ABU3WST5_9NOCA|nr:IclR family transcriptional regulator [Rhodococcus zopfii]
MPPSDKGPRDGETPSILTKAFDLLKAFNAQERVMTLSELSRASGLPKSTVHRLLARLVDLGAVEPHRSGYKIGMGLLQLGAATPAGYMRDVALPYLTTLHQWTGHTVLMGALRGFDVVYLEKIAQRDSPVSIATIGTRLPANCTALGLALLAYEDLDDLRDFLPSPLPRLTAKSVTGVDALIERLRQVRAEGIARESEEAQPGLACIAAPIVMNGFAVGAISVGYPVSNPPTINVSGALRTTARQIVDELKAGLAQGREHWFPREV